MFFESENNERGSSSLPHPQLDYAIPDSNEATWGKLRKCARIVIENSQCLTFWEDTLLIVTSKPTLFDEAIGLPELQEICQISMKLYGVRCVMTIETDRIIKATRIDKQTQKWIVVSSPRQEDSQNPN